MERYLGVSFFETSESAEDTYEVKAGKGIRFWNEVKN